MPTARPSDRLNRGTSTAPPQSARKYVRNEDLRIPKNQRLKQRSEFVQCLVGIAVFLSTKDSIPRFG